VAALRSSALRAAFFRWKAATERAGYVDALPDPIVSYTRFFEHVETRVGPQNQKLSVRQKLPWVGRRDAREHQALYAADAARQQFESARLALAFRVRAAYADYYYVGREIAITRENFDLVRYWEHVAEEKYRVALTHHADVIRAQVELGELEDRVTTLKQMVRPTAARLRAALSLPDSVTLPLPAVLHVPETRADRARMRAQILAHNPDLKSLRDMIDGRRQGVRLAGKASWPDVTLAFDYVETGPAVMPGIPDSGKDPWSLSVGVNVPLQFGANAQKKREASARVLAARYRFEDARDHLDATIDRVLFEYNDALRKIHLYRDGLVPKARQSLEANYTSYETGEIDFLNVLDAERTLLDFRLRYERAIADLASRRAELEMLGGQELAAPEE